jgi:hypothetical protein
MLRILALITILCFFMAGCSSTSFKQAAYEGLHSRQCIEKTGNPDCDPDHISYEEYKKERDKLKTEK